jgi:small subunit ribosomal protein S17
MSNQRKLTGIVVSNKMDKTAVVTVTRQVKHKVGKYHKLSSRYKVHDENNVLKTGDTVIIGEVRPISKDKAWTLLEVVGHATGVEE